MIFKKHRINNHDENFWKNSQIITHIDKDYKLQGFFRPLYYINEKKEVHHFYLLPFTFFDKPIEKNALAKISSNK